MKPEIQELRDKLDAAIKNCQHEYVRSLSTGRAECDNCGVDGGKYCPSPNSPNHLCLMSEKSWDFDSYVHYCKYCGGGY